MSKKDDQVRIHHMCDAAKEAVQFAEGHTREDLNTDRGLVLILVKDIEIVGEAAAHVSPETIEKCPEIP